VLPAQDRRLQEVAERDCRDRPAGLCNGLPYWGKLRNLRDHLKPSAAQFGLTGYSGYNGGDHPYFGNVRYRPDAFKKTVDVNIAATSSCRLKPAKTAA